MYCGVNSSLTVDMVAYALKCSNRGNCIVQKRIFNTVAYYVPSIFEEFSVLPTDQRYTANNTRGRRIDINPDRRYFTTCSEATSYLDEVNAVLDAYDEENRQMEEELIELQNTPEDNLWRGCQIGPYDGNIIMQCSRMDDFIELVSEHSAKCGHKITLIERCTKRGAFVKEVWKCHGCHEQLKLTNCRLIKTAVVDRERTHSRKQPEINLRIAKAFTVGINMTKTKNFLSTQLGIKMSNKISLLHQNFKIRDAIKEVVKGRFDENRREHVSLTRGADDYMGDVEWEEDGVTHSTSNGAVSMDGAGCTRSYNHRHKGKQSIAVANSSITKKPLALVHSQVRLIILFMLIQHQILTLPLLCYFRSVVQDAL